MDSAVYFKQLGSLKITTGNYYTHAHAHTQIEVPTLERWCEWQSVSGRGFQMTPYRLMWLKMSVNCQSKRKSGQTVTSLHAITP